MLALKILLALFLQDKFTINNFLISYRRPKHFSSGSNRIEIETEESSSFFSKCGNIFIPANGGKRKENCISKPEEKPKEVIPILF